MPITYLIILCNGYRMMDVIRHAPANKSITEKVSRTKTTQSWTCINSEMSDLLLEYISVSECFH